MGMSLCNLQIYNPERKEYKIKEGYILSHVVEGWDTVMECDGKYDLYRLARLARELSSELNTPVVSVYYFDDDEFELTSTVDGKKAASFSLGHLGRSSKKLSDLIQSLRLDDKDAKVFRYLTRKDMYADEAIGEFSAVCNLPFYLYPEMKTFDQIPAELIENKKRILDEIKRKSPGIKKRTGRLNSCLRSRVMSLITIQVSLHQIDIRALSECSNRMRMVLITVRFIAIR